MSLTYYAVEYPFLMPLVVTSNASNSSSPSRKASLPQGNEDMPTYKEVFVAPKLSLVACLMKKPTLPPEKVPYDYDSSASDTVNQQKLLFNKTHRVKLPCIFASG